MDKRIEFLEDFKKLLVKFDVELETIHSGYCDEAIEIETDFSFRKGCVVPDINFGAYVDINKIETLIEEIIKDEKSA